MSIPVKRQETDPQTTLKLIPSVIRGLSIEREPAWAGERPSSTPSTQSSEVHEGHTPAGGVRGSRPAFFFCFSR
jgi:hypothetical protein